MKRKLINAFSALLIAVFMLSACTPPAAAVTVSLNKTSAAMNIGDVLFLTETVENADDGYTVLWTSADDAVASVSDGLVTALTAGNTVIKASVGDASATCAITVAKPALTVALDRAAASMNAGETIQLTETVRNADAGYTVVWTSSDDAVAGVAGGLVTALAKGMAVIKASVGSAYAVCAVTVSEPELKLSLVMREDTEFNRVTLGQYHTFEVPYTLSGADASDLEWESSDETVATVSGGVITGVSAGTATVTAVLTQEISASLDVEVYEGRGSDPNRIKNTTGTTVSQYTGVQGWWASEAYVYTFSAGTNNSDMRMVGTTKTDEEQIMIRFDFVLAKDFANEYTGGYYGNMIGNICFPNPWTHVECIKDSTQSTPGYEGKRLRLYDESGEMIEYVDENTLKANTKYTFEFDIASVEVDKQLGIFFASYQTMYISNVNIISFHDSSVRIEISPASISLLTDRTAAASATVKNADASDIVWSTGDTAVATVTEEGVVTGVSEGRTRLYATIGDVSSSVWVIVTQREVVVTLSDTSAEISEAETKQLTANVRDALEGYTVEWSSDDETVLTVDQTGKMRGIAEGTATVTAAVKENGVTVASAACGVTVNSAPVIIEMELADGKGDPYTGASVAVGNKLYLRPAISGAAFSDIVWSSDDESIATVSGGCVTGVAAGSAVITGTAGSESVTCDMTVYAGIGSVPLKLTATDSSLSAYKITDYSGTQTWWQTGTYVYAIPVGQKNSQTDSATLRFGFTKASGQSAVRFEFLFTSDFNAASVYCPYGGDNITGNVWDYVECVKASNAQTPGYEGSCIKLYDASGVLIQTPTEATFKANTVYIMEMNLSSLAVGKDVGIFMGTNQTLYAANVQILTA